MRPIRAKPLGVVCVLCAALVSVGCGKGASAKLETPTAKNLEKIGDAYLRACTRLNRPPANMAELMLDLKDQGVPAEILRSPNDGAEFEIVWGVELRRLRAKGNDVPIIAYEKRGKDGKRYVLRGRDEPLELSDSELRSAKFPDGYVLPF
jgi:hypothetical protein